MVRYRKNFSRFRVRRRRPLKSRGRRVRRYYVSRGGARL